MDFFIFGLFVYFRIFLFLVFLYISIFYFRVGIFGQIIVHGLVNLPSLKTKERLKPPTKRKKSKLIPYFTIG